MSAAPRPADTPLRLRVAASTSNLGPGFDLLGLALGMHLDVRLERTDEGGAHALSRTGDYAHEAGDDASERVLLAFDLAARRLDVAGTFHFALDHGIPIGRGLGSSGAATCAGLLLASALAERGPAVGELVAWGIELEGHPDNVTASLLGGCTVCHPDPDGRGPAWYRPPVHESIRVAVAWPDAPLETSRARAALPATLPLADAVENPRRLALLLEGLRTGDARLLAAGGEDRVHVASRLPLVPGAAAALEAARDAGAWLATISGAGSGLVALGPEDQVASVAGAMRAAFRAAGAGGDARVVDVVRTPPRIERG